MPKPDPIKEHVIQTVLSALTKLEHTNEWRGIQTSHLPGDYEVHRIDNLNISVRFKSAAGPRRFMVRVSELY